MHSINIGVLALQGGYQLHQEYLHKLKVGCVLVRDANTLAITDALIIPGGESSVFIKLLQNNRLWKHLIHYEKPILGVCAGAILLAKKVLSPIQPSLNRIHITIERNAYGRQLASQVTTGTCLLRQCKIEIVFIRAPKITSIDSKKVKVIVHCSKQAIAVQEDNVIAATFHPELSQDTYLYQYFIQQVQAHLNK